MQTSHDVIVIGAGVIGTSVAFHLARLGARRVLVLDRTQIGAGTTSQSSGILRTHYSVRENVAMAKDSWKVFTDFAAYLGDEEASAGLVKCGYLIAAPDGPQARAPDRRAGGPAAAGHRGPPARSAAGRIPAADRRPARRGPDRLRAGSRFRRRLPGGHQFRASRAARRGAHHRRRGGAATAHRGWARGGCGHRPGSLHRRHRDQHPEHLGHSDRAMDGHRHTREVRASHRAGPGGARALHLQDAGLQRPGLAGHAVLPKLRRHPDAGQRGHRGRGAARSRQRAG